MFVKGVELNIWVVVITSKKVDIYIFCMIIFFVGKSIWFFGVRVVEFGVVS